MSWLVFKYLVTAAVVVAVSEIAKRSDKLGGLIAALPLVTVLALIWMHVERQDETRIANHARYTFWYVVPTLPMFMAFPLMMPHYGFWPSLFASTLIALVCFAGFAWLIRQFGVELWQ